MSSDQILLITMFLGRALDAILLKISQMTEEEVKDAINSEKAETNRLLAEMISIT